jgi:hypothetical protein
MRPFSSPSWSRCLPTFRTALVISAMLASSYSSVQAQGKERTVEHPTSYRTAQVDGLSIFYREAGSK